jgi:hypothetical protein
LAERSLAVREEAALAARRELGQALAAVGGDAFAHSDRSDAHAQVATDGAAAPIPTKGLAEIFSQLEVAEAMQVRQVQSLLIEPLHELLEEPRGLGSVPKLESAYGSYTNDLYESLNEFLALEGEGASAAAAKANAKTTAKATAKAGAALAILTRAPPETFQRVWGAKEVICHVAVFHYYFRCSLKLKFRIPIRADPVSGGSGHRRSLASGGA